jgi:predicted RNA-binding protein with PUA-like domain
MQHTPGGHKLPRTAWNPGINFSSIVFDNPLLLVYSLRPKVSSKRDRHKPKPARDHKPAGPAPKRRFWLFSADPHHYHWDTLFVKGKEMWRGAKAKPYAQRLLKQINRGDRVLCYHLAPERSLYALAEVTRTPYPDPGDPTGKNLVADLRALERLPRQVTLDEIRENPTVRKMKFLKNVRLIISALTEEEYQELLRMAGIVASPGMPLP